MEHLRNILVGLVAVSLVILPVGAAEMRSAMAAGMSDTAATHAECCPEMEHCDKQTNNKTKNGCDHSGACALKCSVMPATTVAGIGMTPPRAVRETSAPLSADLRSALDNPPPPPPRA